MSDEKSAKLGSVCHLEIPAPDLEKMQTFYGAVFGWEFTPMGDEYMLFSTGDGGGGFDPALPVADGGAVLILAVDDIQAALTQIEDAGGEGLTPKTEISGDHGSCAYFRDPCGNKMGIWSGS